MAELLALPASIAAIVQLAEYGFRFARTLHSFASHAGSASEEIELFEIQVRSSSQVIGLARASLHQHCSKHPDSSVLTYISAHNVIDDLAKESKLVEKRLRNARHQVMSMNSWHKLLVMIKWSLRKASILGLSADMEKVKTSLGLILATAHFEVANLALSKAPLSSEERVVLQKEM